MSKKKKKNMKMEQRLCHLPNHMHLDACIQGGNIYRDRTVYSRKGKEKFNLKKELSF